MQKLQVGEFIMLVIFGGFIMIGYVVQLLCECGWVVLLVCFFGFWVRFVNVGFSGIDLVIGVQCLQVQVLDKLFDFVVVEFGVNDQWLDLVVCGSSFEVILCCLLIVEKLLVVVVLGLI